MESLITRRHFFRYICKTIWSHTPKEIVLFRAFITSDFEQIEKEEMGDGTSSINKKIRYAYKIVAAKPEANKPFESFSPK